MSDWNPQANELFLEALDRQAGRDRAEYLDAACRGDEKLRAQVVALLEGNEQAGEFLSSPADETLRAAFEETRGEEVGTVIGPYTLLGEIGEGGMGVVYRAEQSQPVRRTVALKILKPGMDSRQVVARIEAERQALALMDHPNIARVIDAGTTGGDRPGRPYFVMELVNGVPITKYCDAQRLPPSQRLELFLHVCRAIQHAHQKGIVHRDLKPSNVIVALYDGRPVPKVIDFGVAKATGPKLTEHTLVTEFGAVIGTLDYMSPEQCELNQLDVDTRTDIYSLGAMLYELMAAETPFDPKRLRSAGFDEARRIIREEEPPRPSAKLRASRKLPAIAANHRTEPGKLSNELQGDLDWIVMKSLEKDRNRRYASAGEFAADIERYLRDEPVTARPPSVLYRLRRFASRNRRALVIAAIFLLSALMAVSGIGWAMRERAAREALLTRNRAARQARATGQLEVILDEVTRLEQAQKWGEALNSARRAVPALEDNEAAPEILNQAREALAALEFVGRLEEIRTQSGSTWGTIQFNMTPLAAKADEDYAEAFRNSEIDVDILPAEEAAMRITACAGVAPAILPAMDDWVAARSKVKDEAATRRLANVLRAADPDPWRQQIRDRLAEKDIAALEELSKSPELDRQPAATLSFLCAAIRQQSEAVAETPRPEEQNLDLAWQGFNLEIEILRRAQRRFPGDFWINHRLGYSLLYKPAEDAKDGVGYLRAAVAARPESAHALMNLGTGFGALKRYDDALACYRRSIQLIPEYGACYLNLGIALRRIGLYEEAISAFEQASKLQPDRNELTTEANAELAMLLCICLEHDLRNPRRAAELAKRIVQQDPNWSKQWTALGVAQYRDGKFREAQAAFDKALHVGKQGLAGWNRWDEAIDWFFLAMCDWRLGNRDEARRLHAMGVGWIEKVPWPTDDLVPIRAEVEALIQPEAGESR